MSPSTQARLEAFRPRYPILARKTYLASHSLGAVPAASAEALLEYHRHWAEMGILAWDGPWWDAMTGFNAQIEVVLGARPGTVVPMENATRGMSVVASCLDWSSRRNRIVLTSLEFITSYPFWQGVAEQYGAELVTVESEDGITVPIEKLVAAIDDRTLIVPTSQVYFRSGALQDLRAVTEAAHRHGAYALGDGYQGVGTVPTDVAAMGIDFFVGGSHKWLCGGPGAGYLYVRPDLIPKLRPRLSGWFGVKDPFTYRAGTAFPPADGVFRFLGGTPAVPALYAAREGIKAVLEAGLPAIREHSRAMTSFIVEQADRRGIAVRTPRDPELRSGMVCIEFEGSKQVAEKLVEQGIVVDWRPNCGIRVSPHFYNVRAELERFFSALDGARAEARPKGH
jgi:kynureninase